MQHLGQLRSAGPERREEPSHVRLPLIGWTSGAFNRLLVVHHSTRLLQYYCLYCIVPVRVILWAELRNVAVFDTEISNIQNVREKG